MITSQEGGNELASIIDVDSTPIILGSTMYAVGYNGDLAAIEVRTGKVMWKRAYSSFQSMTISGFNLFLTTSKGHVFAVDRRSGLEVWSQLGLENRELTAPAVLGQHVAVVDFEGYLHFFDHKTGELVSRKRVVKGAISGSPVVIDDYLYVQNESSEMAVFSISEESKSNISDVKITGGT